MAQTIRPMFKYYPISTRHPSASFKKMFITACDVVYCQIKNEGAFPARQLLLHLKCFHSVPIHLFYQINNTALRGDRKPLIKKSNLSQGNGLMTWSSLSLPISVRNSRASRFRNFNLIPFPLSYNISPITVVINVLNIRLLKVGLWPKR